MSFDCISDCKLGGKCDNKHRCAFCDGHMHVICGHGLPEEHPKWSITYSSVCNKCQRGTEKSQTVNEKDVNNNNNTNKAPAEEDDDEDPGENDTLASLARPAKRKAPRAKKQQQKPPPKKKKKRAARPESQYIDDPTEDPSAWTFPTDKPEYLSPFVDFMNFVHNTDTYTKFTLFTKQQLLTLQPRHVLAYLTHKAFGKTKRKPEDKPVYARSNHIKNIKMKLSYFMPSGSPWVDDGGHGNPTKHKSINKLIAEIVQFEIRGEGAESADVRDMQVEELQKELELF